jgi:hypothetical protein
MVAPARIESPHEDVDTALVELSPEFLERLRSIAPRRRRVKLAHVLALGVIGVAATLGADRSVREIGYARWRRWVNGPPAASVEPAPVAVPEAPTSEPPRPTTMALAAAAPASDPPAVAQPKKVDRRGTSRAAQKARR